MDFKNIYVPVWLNSILQNEITRDDIIAVAEKQYGELSVDDKELFEKYLNDLIEEEFIYQFGNFIYLNNNYKAYEAA